MPAVADRLRRALAAGAATVLAAATAAGIAGAQTIYGTGGPDHLVGTSGPDTLYGRGGNDSLLGLGGADLLDGGAGRDVLSGGSGDDRLAAQADGARDTLLCGAGADTVTAELDDVVAPDCETVSRQLLRDPFSGFDGQHETAVEPDSFAYGSTIVTVFQVGRYADRGGAAATGFARSGDGGRTWRAGLLPGLTVTNTPSGPFERVSDPVVAYDAVHRTWLASSLTLDFQGTGVAINRSRDGFNWGGPIQAIPAGSEMPDKEWIVCDNRRDSRFRGSCYLAYAPIGAARIAVRTSRDGGATWSQPVGLPVVANLDGIVNGPQPVVGRNGVLVVLYSIFASSRVGVDRIVASRSSDGGRTFGPETRVSSLETEEVVNFRVPPFVSAEVAADGRIWAAWSDCRFDSDCSVNSVALTSSSDGVRWTTPVRVSTQDPRLAVDDILPGLGVDPASAGARTRLGLVYHTVPQQGSCGLSACGGVDVYFVGSSDAGRTWTNPVRLSTQSMNIFWIADGGLGRLLGDYVSLSWVAGRPIPVFSLASAPPFAGDFRQAIFAATQIVGYPGSG